MPYRRAGGRCMQFHGMKYHRSDGLQHINTQTSKNWKEHTKNSHLESGVPHGGKKIPQAKYYAVWTQPLSAVWPQRQNQYLDILALQNAFLGI